MLKIIILSLMFQSFITILVSSATHRVKTVALVLLAIFGSAILGEVSHISTAIQGLGL
jgi:hypothetical protein